METSLPYRAVGAMFWLTWKRLPGVVALLGFGEQAVGGAEVVADTLLIVGAGELGAAAGLGVRGQRGLVVADPSRAGFVAAGRATFRR